MSETQVDQFKGYGGTLRFEGTELVLARDGVIGRATHGKSAIGGSQLRRCVTLYVNRRRLPPAAISSSSPEIPQTMTPVSGHQPTRTRCSSPFNSARRIARPLSDWANWRRLTEHSRVPREARPPPPMGGMAHWSENARTLQGQVGARSAELHQQTAGRMATAGGIDQTEALTGVSHEAGRNAIVTLLSERIERVKSRSLASLSSSHQDVEVTPLRNVSSVQAKKDNVLWTKVTVYAVGNNIDFKFTHDEAKRFTAEVQRLLLAPPPTAAPASSIPPPNTAIDDLRALAELHTAGVLTDDEFASKKPELLSRM
jgi:hypothetical protein